MSKFKKIDREFTLSDSSLNSYSYRLLTSGYLMDEFKKNPIGYYMHGTEEHPREQGVLVKWEDLRIDGDVVKGKPCINLSHPRGQRTVDEIESGFLNAASFGNMKVLEISSNPADYLEGQTGLTASKWFNRECSLVDQPGNYNATANSLFDENDNPLNLSDYTPQNLIMKQIFLTPAQLAMLPNLKAEATQDEVNTAFKDLIEKAAKVDTLTTELSTAKTEKETAKTELADLKASTTDAQVADLLDKGVEAKKITMQGKAQLAADYKGKPAELKNLIDSLPAYQGIVKNLNPELKKVADLMDKSYDELDKEGKLEALKAAAPDTFFEKFEAHFGKRHATDTRK